MIKLKLNYFDGSTTEEVITPLIFNDKTSQIWKIKSLTQDFKSVLNLEVLLMFEN